MTAKSTREIYISKSDEELVRLSRADEDAFYVLIKRYEVKILRYIKRMIGGGGGQEEAEDILQEIFIKVYRHLNSFNVKLKFSSWLYRIARNEIINHYHRNKKQLAMVSLDDISAAGLSAELISNEDIYGAYAEGETGEQVKKAMENLPLKYREVLILRFFENKDYKDISDILRKPPGTVATLLNRAKTKFRKIAELQHLESPM